MADHIARNSLMYDNRNGMFPCPRPVGDAAARDCRPVLKEHALGRSERLLQLACRAVNASLAGIGFVAPNGELGYLTIAVSSASGTTPDAGGKNDNHHPPANGTDDRDRVIRHRQTGRSPDITDAGWLDSSWERWITQLVPLVDKQPVPMRVAVPPVPSPALPDGLIVQGSESGASARSRGIGPFLGIPLHCPQRGRGIFFVARPGAASPFTAHDEEVLRPIGPLLEERTVLEEPHLFVQLRLLNQVAQVAASSLDLSGILSRSLRELTRNLPRHIAAVWVIEGDPPRRVALSEVSPQACEQADTLGLRRGMHFDVPESPFVACIQDGEPMYVDLTLEETDAPLFRAIAAGGGRFLFMLPLRAGDRCVGVLQAVCTSPGGFTGEQIQVLYLVADLLGPAISNCHLYHCLLTAYEKLRIAQGRLVEAEKMRAVGQLASGMAHEFNNALCGVLGFIDLALMRKGIEAGARGCLETARTCALDAAETVRRVQDFARQRNDESAVTRLDLNHLVRQTVDMTRHKWDNHARTGGGAVTVKLETQEPLWIRGVAVELREVLTNLLFNAVDAMPGGGTITIRTWQQADSAFLAIADTGVGIPAEVRKRIFEPFVTTKGEQGTGLGLSISFGIVQRHGGEISVESEENNGTVFTIRLPVAPVADAPGSPAVDADAERKTPTVGGLRVLIAEDEENIRRFLADGLNQLGHHPTTAPSGEHALELVTHERFDAVLTDLGLPDLSGEEVARRIAEIAPGTPIILLTGWAEQLKAESRKIQGISRILGKPISLETLAAALSDVCHDSPQ